MAAPVAILGNGIAGAAACLILAERGVPVRWIAPGAASASADKPGETLSAAAAPLLRALGLEALLDDPAHRRVESTFTAWGSEALLERDRMAAPAGLGHVVHRGRLEAGIAAHAAGRPGVAVTDARVTAVRQRAAGWALETDAGETIDASFLVDATGRDAVVGRRDATLKRCDRLVAACAFLDQADAEVEPTPATLVEAVPTGWWYATLLAGRRLAVNYYSDADLMPRGLRHDGPAWRRLVAQTRYVSRWIESAGFDVSGSPVLTAAGTTWLSRPAGSGWVAVGDAAAAFDPLSSHGMTTALWTGVEAGKAVERALKGSTEELEAYAERVLRGVERCRADRQAVYGRAHRFALHPFWRRRRQAAPPPAGTLRPPSLQEVRP